ncbi:MAG: hypothetical protein KAT46_05370 [Deltaproteobacteria bacterium]|nr:hypothetical protein [Deltaproteobacteria bacterium]
MVIKKTTKKKTVTAKKVGKKTPAKKKPRWQRDSNETYFDVIETACDFLVGRGFKIGTSKLAKDAGRLFSKKPDGSIAEKDLLIYARKFLTPLDGSDKNLPSAEKKMQAEARAAEARAIYYENRNDIAARLLILRSEEEQVHTKKLAVFITAVDHLLKGGPLGEVVELVGGDMKKLPEAREFLREEFKQILTEYAKAPTYTIPKASVLGAEEFKEENAD